MTSNPTEASFQRSKLYLHCGAAVSSRDDLFRVPTPASTPTWSPLPHLEVLHVVESALYERGLHIVEEAHSLNRDKSRYFGLLRVSNGRENSEYCSVVGVRNSHDKTFPAGIVAGTAVLVCANLAFDGDIKLARKHTSRIRRDLPGLALQAIDRVVGHWQANDRRIAAYKQSLVYDRMAHDLVIRALDAGVCTNQQVPRVLQEWREPSHQAFAPRNLWSLHNAFTETLKGNLNLLPERTERLHGLLDEHIGLRA